MGCGYMESCRELFKELKILPLSSQYIFRLFQIVYIITLIPDKEIIYTCDLITQASKSLMVFPRQLRTSPASLKSLKLL